MQGPSPELQGDRTSSEKCDILYELLHNILRFTTSRSPPHYKVPDGIYQSDHVSDWRWALYTSITGTSGFGKSLIDKYLLVTGQVPDNPIVKFNGEFVRLLRLYTDGTDDDKTSVLLEFENSWIGCKPLGKTIANEEVLIGRIVSDKIDKTCIMWKQKYLACRKELKKCQKEIEKYKQQIAGVDAILEGAFDRLAK